jgi:hypothetical protein
VFPHDDIAPKQVRTWRDEIAAAGIVQLYRVDGREYGYFPDWAVPSCAWAQRIDRPQPSNLPPPPSGSTPEPFVEASTNGSSSHSSKDRRATVEPGAEQPASGSTEDRKGVDKEGNGSGNARAARQTRIPDGLTLADRRAKHAADHGMTRDVAHREFAKFRTWHTSKGSKHVDWDQAWLTWVLRWQENTPKPQVEAHPDLPEGWA